MHFTTCPQKEKGGVQRVQHALTECSMALGRHTHVNSVEQRSDEKHNETRDRTCSFDPCACIAAIWVSLRFFHPSRPPSLSQ